MTCRRLPCIALVSLVLLAVPPARAADPTAGPAIRISQFEHTAWTEKEGAPTAILALAQTPDGYLWIGTTTGLFRFDGKAFEQITEFGGRQLPHQPISALRTDSEGGLWIGYTLGGGVQYVKNGVLTDIRLDVGKAAVGKILTLSNGIAWVIANDGLWQVEQLQATRIDARWKLHAKQISDATQDANGTLWVKSVNPYMVYCLARGATTFDSLGEATNGLLYATPDGWLWTFAGDALSRLRVQGCQPASPSARWETVTLEPTGDPVIAPDGGTWSQNLKGIARDARFEDLFSRKGNHEPAEVFTKAQGLSSPIVRAFFVDRDGNMWTGTDAGLDRFRRTPFTPVALPGRATGAAIAAAGGAAIWAAPFDGPLLKVDAQGFTQYPEVGPRLSTLYRDTDGTLWAGGDRARAWHSNQAGGFTKLPQPPFLSGERQDFNAMARDETGVLWAGLNYDMRSFRFSDGRWSVVAPDKESAHARPVAAIMVDEAGRVWQSRGYTVVITDHGQSRELQGMPAIGFVVVLYRHGSHIWLGGSEGLALFDGQRMVRLVPREGKPFPVIRGIVERTNGDVWIHGKREALLIRAPDLSRTMAASDLVVDVERFDAFDGLAGHINTQRPSVIEADDGKLWFATDTGVAWVDPAQLLRKSRPVTVRILTLNADGKAYPIGTRPVIGELNQRAEMTFTVIDLSGAERRRFRYRLDGIDNDWHDAGTSRVAQFNNLPPGDYGFHVQVTDERGAWLDEGANMAFTVPPAWFQTLWFRTLCFLLGCVAVWLLHRWRVQHQTRQAEARVRLQLETRARERERIARELHDTLLQGTTGLVLNFQVAVNRLPRDEPARPGMQALLTEADKVVEEARVRVTELRLPSDDATDFAEELRRMGDAMTAHRGLAFELLQSGTGWCLMEPVQDQLSMMVREALGNALQHARANRIEIRLAEENGLRTVRVIDDGVGFASDHAAKAIARGHWGLFGLRERAAEIGAQLEILSEPGSGTEIRISMPTVRPSRLRAAWQRFLERARAIAKPRPSRAAAGSTAEAS